MRELARPEVGRHSERKRFSEMSYGFAIVFHKNPRDVEECCRYIDSFWQHDMELDEHGTTAIEIDIPEPVLGREYATRNLPAPMPTEELAWLARRELKALFFYRYQYSTRFFRKGGEREQLASLDDFLAWRTINGAMEYPCYLECPRFHYRLARHMTLLNDLFDFPRDREAGSPNLVSQFGGDVHIAVRFFNDSLDAESDLLQCSEAMNAYFRYLYWQVDPKSQRDRGCNEAHYAEVLGLLRIKAPGADYLYLNEARADRATTEGPRRG
jgi:hypothetical protein